MTSVNETQRYNLDEEQRHRWVQQLPILARGAQKKLAERLHKVAGGELSSWKNVISGFLKGKEPDLKTVFENPKRLAAVAEGLSLTSTQLRERLANARGLPAEDRAHEALVPGFEDLGAVPILQAYNPPWVSGIRASWPPSAEVPDMLAGRLDLEPYLHAIEAKSPDTPLAFVFVSEPGLGRTPTLRALAASLEQRGREVLCLPAIPQGPHDIILQDDLDRVSSGERERLMQAVKDTKATLIAASSTSDRLDDRPGIGCVSTLGPGSISWAVEYLEHLEHLWGKRGHPLELDQLRRQLVDDPYASALAGRPDTLGMLARHVKDRGALPTGYPDLVPLAIEHWARRLRARSKGATALTLEVCGREALESWAAIACETGRDREPLRAVCRLFVDAAHGLAGTDRVPWAGLGDQGMMTVVEDLVDVGMLHREGDTLRVAQPTVLTTALGDRLDRRLEDQSLLSAAIMQPAWHDSLVAAAGKRGDPCPLLEAIEALTPGVRCMAFPALTRLLGASPSPTDAEIFDRAFRRCLHRWASKTNPERIGSLSPLVVLGLASQRHRSHLRPLTADDITNASDVEDALVVASLALTGWQEPTPEDVRLALMIGAPYQAAELLDASLWRRLPPHAHHADRVMFPDDFEFWWRQVAAPRLAEEPDGSGRIVGTVGGMSIRSSMMQRRHGSELWRNALLERITAEDEASPAAFAEAVVWTLRSSMRANARGIMTLWKEIPRHLRTRLRAAASEALLLVPLDEWGYDEDWTAWMLRKISDAPQRLQLWDRWINDASPTSRDRPPWRSFYAAGLPAQLILQWALEEPDPQAESDDSDYFATALFATDDEQTPREAAIDYFLESDDVEALCALASMARDSEWDVEQDARHRLRELDPQRLRSLDLELAIGMEPEDRAARLAMMQPITGEEASWLALADSARTLSERLLRLVQAECARDDDGDWTQTRRALALLEAVDPGGLTKHGSAAASSEHAAWLAKDDTCDDLGVKGPNAPQSETLEQIGLALVHARERRPKGLHELVDFACSSQPLLCPISEQSRIWWWVLATCELGSERALHMLKEAHRDATEEGVLRARLTHLATLGWLDLVKRAVLDPELSSLAAPILAARITAHDTEALHDVLANLSIVNESGLPSEPARALIGRWAELDGGAATRWLRAALEARPEALSTAWWAHLVESLPSGRARAEAIDTWLSTSEKLGQGSQ